MVQGGWGIFYERGTPVGWSYRQHSPRFSHSKPIAPVIRLISFGLITYQSGPWGRLVKPFRTIGRQARLPASMCPAFTLVSCYIVGNLSSRLDPGNGVLNDADKRLDEGYGLLREIDGKRSVEKR